MNLPNEPSLWLIGFVSYALLGCLGLGYRALSGKKSLRSLILVWLMVGGVVVGGWVTSRSAMLSESEKYLEGIRPYGALVAEALSDVSSQGGADERDRVLSRWVTTVPDLLGIAVLRPYESGLRASTGIERTESGPGTKPLDRLERWILPAGVTAGDIGDDPSIFEVAEPRTMAGRIGIAARVGAGKDERRIVLLHLDSDPWREAVALAERSVFLGAGLLVSLVLLGSATFSFLVDRNRELEVSRSELLIQQNRIKEQMELIADKNQQMADSRSQLEEAYAKLHTLATMDGLTGVLNHRALMDTLSAGIRNNRAIGSPCSVVLLDIDNFKQLNDEYGHMAGDEALKVVARVLRQQVPVDCSVGRYGGEEFMMVLPGYSESAALDVGEKIRAGIEAAPQGSRPLTASVGVATVYSMAKSEQTLVDEADRAMYAAKRAGKNLVFHFGRLGERETA